MIYTTFMEVDVTIVDENIVIPPDKHILILLYHIGEMYEIRKNNIRFNRHFLPQFIENQKK